MPTYGNEDISMLLSLVGCLVPLPRPRAQPQRPAPPEDVEPEVQSSQSTLTM